MAKFATNVKATFTDIRRVDKGSIIGMSKICEQYIIDAMDWKPLQPDLKESRIFVMRQAVRLSSGRRRMILSWLFIGIFAKLGCRTWMVPTKLPTKITAKMSLKNP